MHGVKTHNGRSWWRLSQVWRKFADTSTWLRFQKMHFRPGTKTVLVITPSRGFRGRQRLILGTKWMSLPILQPSSVFLSRFHLRVLSDASRPVGAAASAVGTGFCLECETFVAYLQGSTRTIDLHTVKLIGSLTESYYCVSYFRSELCFLPHHNCWNTGKMTLRAGLCFPTLGVLKLHPGMLQRTKDDPLLLICSISVVFQPFYMKQPNETFHFSFLRHSWCKFVESRWHLQEALSPAFRSWQPLKDAFTKPSVSPEHCGNVAYFSQFPTLSDTRTPSFNTC